MKNPAASVRARLLTFCQQRGLVFNDMLIRYTLEGLLARVADSPHGEQFVLKGGMLYPLWGASAKAVYRSTRDLDFLGYGTADPDRVLALFQSLTDSPEASSVDGLAFPADAMRAQTVREDNVYSGIRLDIEARLGSAVIPFHVDVGFGDSVCPAAQSQEYPRMLELPSPTLRVYPPETVIAEKFQAMVVLGMSNSRMKDFFDLSFLSSRFELRGDTLGEALRATFAHRKTVLPTERPLALTDAFAKDPGKQAQWNAFLRKNRFPETAFAKVVQGLDVFLSPLLLGKPVAMRWLAGGPWEA